MSEEERDQAIALAKDLGYKVQMTKFGWHYLVDPRGGPVEKGPEITVHVTEYQTWQKECPPLTTLRRQKGGPLTR